MVKDPVCQMEFEEKKAAGQTTYKEQVYHFCTMNCKRRFDHSPEYYLNRTRSKQAEYKDTRNG